MLHASLKINLLGLNQSYENVKKEHGDATRWILTKSTRCDGINLLDKPVQFECSEPGELIKIHLIAMVTGVKDLSGICGSKQQEHGSL